MKTPVVGTRKRGRTWEVTTDQHIQFACSVLPQLEVELLTHSSLEPLTFTIFSENDAFHRVPDLEKTLSKVTGYIKTAIGHFTAIKNEVKFDTEIWIYRHENAAQTTVRVGVSGPNSDDTDEYFSAISSSIEKIIRQTTASPASATQNQVGTGTSSAVLTTSNTPTQSDPLDEIDALLKVRGERRQRVFISYSHDSEAHKNWTYNLACELQSVGVWVIFDQFLSLGSNLAVFMNHNLIDSDRVIAVCTPEYIRKANTATGGAGHESTILTQSLMEDQSSDRVIPLIRNQPDCKVPTYLYGRKYVNFNDDSKHAEKFDELARDLLGATKLARPPLGPNPFVAPNL
ncbi:MULTISPECIES: toll/interleukin-1 receptor domain-containing protein [unclassified Rhodococcus (in: high G+C Gram-positive bacteria)]|uniref:toll/interleukin-1 receptor domain-containing protein n=1 Tax=unclassified Rhodococcus (in: high G+C Gram-positive bacteria) TaxID=192944 RepID=UPI0016803AD8|nr:MULTISPECIES: toll/interleukin-1 receptor domain-containing protein [unclassified Rhodococcus (in: high G+C Gram-positive bacteria)]